MPTWSNLQVSSFPRCCKYLRENTVLTERYGHKAESEQGHQQVDFLMDSLEAEKNDHMWNFPPWSLCRSSKCKLASLAVSSDVRSSVGSVLLHSHEPAQGPLVLFSHFIPDPCFSAPTLMCLGCSLDILIKCMLHKNMCKGFYFIYSIML